MKPYKIHWTFTFVGNKVQTDGTAVPSVLTYEEWRDICMSNKGLPAKERRCFIRLYDLDADEKNIMFIEAPYEVYLEWHREHMAYKRNRDAEKNFRFLSMDAHPYDDSAKEYGDLLNTGSDEVESHAMANVTLRNLAENLSGVIPCGAELVAAYVSGQKRNCTKPLAEKCAVSCRAIQYTKKKFEQCAVEFLAQNV